MTKKKTQTMQKKTQTASPRIRTACGFTVDDTLRDACKALNKKNVDQGVSMLWRNVFDGVVMRRGALSTLTGLPSTPPGEIPVLTMIRDEHARLACGLAKLLWKVE